MMLFPFSYFANIIAILFRENTRKKLLLNPTLRGLISRDPRCKERNVRVTTVPCKPFPDYRGQITLCVSLKYF